MSDVKTVKATKRSKSRMKQNKRQSVFVSTQNTETRASSSGGKCENDSHGVLDELKFQYETCHIDKETNFFLCDRLMKKFYEYYPHFICIDVLCEIPEIDHSLVLFIGVDSNGHCEIVSVGLIQSGNEVAFVWTCEMFKKYNSCWEDVELILADECCDRKTLKEAFPDKIIFPSFFHCMKAFKTDLSSIDNEAVDQDVNRALQLFEKMMFVTTETGYLDLLKQMKQMNVQVFNIFKKNWHLKKDMWALGLHTDSKIFLKAFNTYLLNIRRKLKPIISSQETLGSVIRNFHSSLHKFRKEYFQHFTKMFHCPSASYLTVSVMKKYASFVTPFATELVFEQLKKSEYVKVVQKIDRQSYFKVDGVLATTHSCCCNFHKFMKLPCCHILSVRKHVLSPQFVQSVRSSWIFANYREIFFALYVLHTCELEETREIAAEKCQRYEEYVRICSELWSKILYCSPKVSQERLEVYQNMLKAWKSNFSVDIIRSEKKDDKLPEGCENLESLPTDYFTELYGISINDIIDPEHEFMDISINSDTDDNIDLLL